MAPPPKNTIKHFTHLKHPLLDMYEDKEYICGGCNTIGDGRRYRCDPCDFDLHEHCATCPTTLSSFFMHPKHQLNLGVGNPQSTSLCDVCGDQVEGLFYRCNLCDFDVHPHCTQLPQNVRSQAHPGHPLTLVPSSASYCLVCQTVCTSWRYKCGICRVHLHIECVLEPPICDVDDDDDDDDDDHRGLQLYGLNDEFDDYVRMPSGFGPDRISGECQDYESEASIITIECGELSSRHVQQTTRIVSTTRANESSLVCQESFTHEYAMPSGSSSYTMNQNQRHRQGGATNGRKSKKNDIFVLLGNLSIG